MNTYLHTKETKRLLIRPLTMNDVSLWKTFIMHEEATKFFPNNRKMDPIYASNWIRGQLHRYKKDGYGLMALIEKGSNDFIGQCGLIVQEIDGNRELEIGYHLLPNYWGKGYASEAAQRMRQIGFEEENAKSLISIIHPDNRRSQRVAIRNGMIKVNSTYFKQVKVDIYRVNRKSIL